MILERSEMAGNIDSFLAPGTKTPCYKSGCVAFISSVTTNSIFKLFAFLPFRHFNDPSSGRILL